MVVCLERGANDLHMVLNSNHARPEGTAPLALTATLQRVLLTFAIVPMQLLMK